jgi:hypothetical protein
MLVMTYCRSFASLVMTACLLVMATPVRAADSRSADEWKFDATIYLWASSIDIKPQDGDTIHLSFSDLLDNLDMAFMGALGARKDKWSLLTDVIYMDVSFDEKGSVEIPGQNINTKASIAKKAWIVTAAGGYNLVDTGKYSLDLLAGARYLAVDLPIKYKIGSDKLKTTVSANVWDGIIGVRGKVNLADEWYMNYYADGGTGDSSFTWQALAGLNYQFKKVVAGFGYRYLTTYDKDDAIEDLTVKGPYAGVRFFF